MSAVPPKPGTSRSPRHQPVLLREVLEYLELQPGLTVVDGTVGAGGHSRPILERIGPQGRLIGLDRDSMMLSLAAQMVSGPNCDLRQASYIDLPDVLRELDMTTVDRILLDLGLSSDQLADEARGFSFSAGGPLDLRFDTRTGRPAWKFLDHVREEELKQILDRYGEERFSGRIAREIVSRRRTAPIRTAGDLVDVVSASIPAAAQRAATKHPATRVFQALRIAVNKELEHLDQALNDTLYRTLKPGGRLVTITFHSLEDRLVKTAFRDKSRWQTLTPKPITARAVERKMNPRSRTAKLRAAIRK